jgi:hypothetical protein
MNAEQMQIFVDQIVLELEAEYAARFQQIEQENDRLHGELRLLRERLTQPVKETV